MHDAIADFQLAPLWAQIVIVLFALTAVVSVVGRPLRHRRFRRRFDALARELGARPPSEGGWPVTFAVDIDDRTFEVKHDFRRTSSSSNSYRGPRGYLLITTTPLASERWSMHQADISKAGSFASRFISHKQPTGDADFDERFVVVEEGLVVREGWLDAATRQAIAGFLDAAPCAGVIWIRGGDLLFTMHDAWTGVDGQALRELLRRQADLASALDRTAAAQL